MGVVAGAEAVAVGAVVVVGAGAAGGDKVSPACVASVCGWRGVVAAAAEGRCRVTSVGKPAVRER